MQILICPPREIAWRGERATEGESGDVNLLTRNDNEDVISTERGRKGEIRQKVRHNSPDCQIFPAWPVVANAQFNILQALIVIFFH